MRVVFELCFCVGRRTLDSLIIQGNFLLLQSILLLFNALRSFRVDLHRFFCFKKIGRLVAALQVFTDARGHAFISCSSCLLLSLLARSDLYEFVSLKEIRNLRADHSLYLVRCRLCKAHAVEKVVLIHHSELAIGA